MRKIYIPISAIIVIVFAWFFITPKNINATASALPTSVFIGEKIKLEVHTTNPQSITVDFSDIPQKLKDFELKDIKTAEKAFFNHKFSVYIAILQNFSPKEYEIPQLSVKFKDKAGKIIKEIETKKLKITIKSLLNKNDKSAEIKDIKPPLSPSHAWIIYFWAITLLAALATFLIFKYKKQKIEAKILAAISPPHIIALEAINQLRKKDLIARGLIKEFYFQLSLIVRHYLEDRFNLRAPEMTTEEFLLRLKNSKDLTDEHKKLLSVFLTHSDMVKFAKYSPSPNEIDKSLSHAIQLIEQTRNDI